MSGKKGVRNHRISVTSGMRGYFAVMLADYEDMNWGTDVVMSGIGSYKTREGATEEAKEWAKSEEVSYVG